MKNVRLVASTRAALVAMSLAVSAGCSTLFPVAAPQPAVYSLDFSRSMPIPTAATALSRGARPTLIVSPVEAAAGYDSPRMLYVRGDHQVEYFAHNEWVDTPARMLSGIVVKTLDNSGAFAAVVLAPTPAVGDIRLAVEVVRLQQHFGGGPSRVRLTIRAYLVDYATRKVLASGEFDETIVAKSDDPQGGVIAANRAVEVVMLGLATFCADAALQWLHALDSKGQGSVSNR